MEKHKQIKVGIIILLITLLFKVFYICIKGRTSLDYIEWNYIVLFVIGIYSIIVFWNATAKGTPLTTYCIFASTAILFTILVGSTSEEYKVITLPRVELIKKIEISDNLGEVRESYEDREWIELFVSKLSGAKETNRPSVHDEPRVEKFLKIHMISPNEINTLFYYKKNGKYYIEQPYQGIYHTDATIDGFKL